MNRIKEEIGNKKEKFSQLQKDLKNQTNRLEVLEEELLEGRAELVATSGLLEQNENMRKKIQAEEQEKAKMVLEAELKEQREQLSLETQGVRNEVEKQFAEEIGNLRGQVISCKSIIEEKDKELKTLREENDNYAHYIESIESKLVDAEAQLDHHTLHQHKLEEPLEEASEKKTKTEQQALHRAMSENVNNDERGAASATAAPVESSTTSNSTVDEIQFSVFSSLMDEFQTERDGFDQKIKDLQEVIQNATTDILYLTQENHSLRKMLKSATIYEPRIIPNQAKI